jgi:hypothetical protein
LEPALCIVPSRNSIRDKASRLVPMSGTTIIIEEMTYNTSHTRIR